MNFQHSPYFVRSASLRLHTSILSGVQRALERALRPRAGGYREARHSRGGSQPVRGAGIALLAWVLAAGCGPGGEERAGAAGGRAPLVVTTVGMITDAATRIGGDRVRVVGLMGPGVDPHLFRASAGHVRSLTEAALILYGGLTLEAAMGEVLAEMGGRTRTVALAERLPPERLLASDPAFPEKPDPHVWFDVALWQEVVREIAAALIALDPEGEPEFRARADAYLAELAALEEWVRGRVASLPPERRVLVTAHDAFHYFGRAYGFEVRALQGISTVVEPSTADVQALAELLVERGIPAVFVESSVPRRTLEAVEAAVRSRGGTVRIGGELYSDAMGAEGTPEGTYAGMVRHNVDRIVEALGGAAAGGEAP